MNEGYSRVKKNCVKNGLLFIQYLWFHIAHWFQFVFIHLFFDRSRLLFFLISLIGSLHFFNLSIRHRINPINFIINCLKSHDLFHPCWNKNVLQWNDTRCDTNLLFIHIISFRVKKKTKTENRRRTENKKKTIFFCVWKKVVNYLKSKVLLLSLLLFHLTVITFLILMFWHRSAEHCSCIFSLFIKFKSMFIEF